MAEEQSLGDMIRTAMLLHQNHGPRAVLLAEGYLRVAKAAGNESEIARWATILSAVRELGQE